MVSTRGIRYRFTEGERVLCYEPDPTKAKVLYDSKVLEVIETKDKRGRRTVEYLIHFQGWNSSWDRCVSEDFVLKDTEENRQLQRDLAEKSQLQLGAYLYRKERKKPIITAAGPVPIKRARHGFSDDGSSTSTQPDGGGDTDSSMGSCNSQASVPSRVTITLPPALRDRLTFDYHLVVKRNRLNTLPASPSASDILESFVKWFARSGAWRPVRLAKPEPPQKPDFLDVCCRLNLVREVADGLRIYFDYILGDQLLYKQEMNQYHKFCGQFVIPDKVRTKEEKPDQEVSQDKKINNLTVEDNIKSPKIPEYAHLPPDPDLDKIVGSPKVKEEPRTKSTESRKSSDGESAKSKDDPVKPIIVTRRLRSHKSAVSPPQVEESTPAATISEPRVSETQVSSSVNGSVASSESSVCSWMTAQPPLSPAPAQPTRTPLSLLLDKITKWQLIPKENTEHLPCRVYGAIHLARLFVKLPDFLNATPMPDMKLKLILKHIDMFIQYLDEHTEWFGEMHYVNSN